MHLPLHLYHIYIDIISPPSSEISPQAILFKNKKVSQSSLTAATPKGAPESPEGTQKGN